MAEVRTPYKPGTPCWVDVMVPDQAAGLDFYRDLFGWQGEVGPPEFGGYAVCTLHGKPVAGIAPTMSPDGMPEPPPSWTTYLASDDAETTASSISSNGGAVVAPVMEVGSLGKMLVAADPTGAVFGVWESRDFAGAEVVNEPGAFVWSELETSDTTEAGRFYGNAFGLRASTMEGAEDYYGLQVEDRTIGGMQNMPDYLPGGAPAQWLTYFSVADTDSTVDVVTRAGGTVNKAPFDMVAGRMAVVKDPQGATFAVIAESKP